MESFHSLIHMLASKRRRLKYNSFFAMECAHARVPLDFAFRACMVDALGPNPSTT